MKIYRLINRKVRAAVTFEEARRKRELGTVHTSTSVVFYLLILLGR